MRKKKVVEEVPKMRAAPSINPPLNGVRLAPFSGDNTACIKCGNKGAGTSWFSAGRTCIASAPAATSPGTRRACPPSRSAYRTRC
jgi:hypothetical protein